MAGAAGAGAATAGCGSGAGLGEGLGTAGFALAASRSSSFDLDGVLGNCGIWLASFVAVARSTVPDAGSADFAESCVPLIFNSPSSCSMRAFMDCISSAIVESKTCAINR